MSPKPALQSAMLTETAIPCAPPAIGALTFYVTANVVVHTGATPVFADVDPKTFNDRIYQERCGLRWGMFPAADAVSDSTLSLPLSAAMAPDAVERVIEALHDVLG
jgi:dTDP-4-amino-4,6-dideoxygalactose transaminase